MRRGVSAALACMSLALAGAGTAQAAAPANDNFAAAIPLAPGHDVPASNIGSTAEPGEPFGEKAHSVWFTFQAPTSGKYTIETCDESTELDTQLFVYEGTSLATLKEVANNDDGSIELGPPCGGASQDYGSRVTIDATAGTVYRVYVIGFAGRDEGYFYARAYAGEPVARPQPDTGIQRYSSYLSQLRQNVGVVSGPRRIADFPLISIPPGAAFQCSLDGAAYSPCTTPLLYPDLPEGTTHTLLVRAVSGGSVDPTPARETFTIDRTPPATTIVPPPNPLLSREGTWLFGGSELNGAGVLQCTFDGNPEFCAEPTKYKALCDGLHSLSAAAIDRAGNIDPTPAVSNVTVAVGGQPCAPPTIEAAAPYAVEETRAILQANYDEMGAGASVRTEYGPTAGYGSQTPPIFLAPRELTEKEKEEGQKKSFAEQLDLLDPGTTYHYRMTITTPYGSASTGDRTFTTLPATGPLPTIVYGAPSVQSYTASLPATIDAKGIRTTYSLIMDTSSPVQITTSTGLRGNPKIPAGTVGPQAVSMPLVDLEPATTYHYRFEVFQLGEEDSRSLLGPEATFTTLPAPTRAFTVPRTHFKVRARNVRLARLSRRSKRLRARVLGLPAKSVVTVKLFVGSSKQTARKKANKRGRARFKPTLSRRIRKALHKRANKRFRLRVTVSPPGDSASSLTITKKIKRR